MVQRRILALVGKNGKAGFGAFLHEGGFACMSDKEAAGILIFVAAGLLAGLLIGVLVATRGNRFYRRFRNPKKTVGTVTKAEVNGGGWTGDSYTPDTYTFDYCFQDEWGRTFQGSYKNAPKELYKAGDSIPLYYDAAEPQKNIAEAHLKVAKNAYWKIPLTFALILGGVIVVCLLVVLYASLRR